MVTTHNMASVLTSRYVGRRGQHAIPFEVCRNIAADGALQCKLDVSWRASSRNTFELAMKFDMFKCPSLLAAEGVLMRYLKTKRWP